MATRLVVHEGAPALASAGAAPYVYHRDVPAATWTIPNPLGHIPQVTLLDAAGEVVFSDVFVDGTVQVVVTFPTPFAGTAYLS